ncbi:DUF1292 domain-containing protein [Hathewaya histolytica]|uniref:Uncharacterized protein conserved in bacteria n=1 Tax=Hathewaya histolytica TaxID=1498 RepID=A0A4U9RF24_HATHI|nr:DUF1292 domain-containing protein [Hathewaya histolytica]VTQ90404.1 Uncharacterized protein conserved in bacteria [Hathewaya histolytica]
MEKKIETILLTDENGNDVEFEVVEKVLVRDDKYLIVSSIDDDSDEAIALKMEDAKDGNCIFKMVEDEKELQLVEAAYEETFEEN